MQFPVHNLKTIKNNFWGQMQEIFEGSDIGHSSSTSLFEMAGTKINPCKSAQTFLLLLSKEMKIGNARVLWDYGVTEILVLALSF